MLVPTQNTSQASLLTQAANTVAMSDQCVTLHTQFICKAYLLKLQVM